MSAAVGKPLILVKPFEVGLGAHFYDCFVCAIRVGVNENHAHAARLVRERVCPVHAPFLFDVVAQPASTEERVEVARTARKVDALVLLLPLYVLAAAAFAAWAVARFLTK